MLPGSVSDDQGSPFYGRGANSAPARRQGCTQTSTSTLPPSHCLYWASEQIAFPDTIPLNRSPAPQAGPEHPALIS